MQTKCNKNMIRWLVANSGLSKPARPHPVIFILQNQRGYATSPSATSNAISSVRYHLFKLLTNMAINAADVTFAGV